MVDHQFRVQQAEVRKGVFRFLRCGVTKQLGQVFMAQLFGYIRKEQVFAVGHALAAESGFEVGVGGRL